MSADENQTPLSSCETEVLSVRSTPSQNTTPEQNVALKRLVLNFLTRNEMHFLIFPFLYFRPECTEDDVDTLQNFTINNTMGATIR